MPLGPGGKRKQETGLVDKARQEEEPSPTWPEQARSSDKWDTGKAAGEVEPERPVSLLSSALRLEFQTIASLLEKGSLDHRLKENGR